MKVLGETKFIKILDKYYGKNNGFATKKFKSRRRENVLKKIFRAFQRKLEDLPRKTAQV